MGDTANTTDSLEQALSSLDPATPDLLFRRFNLACLRRVWPLLGERFQAAVEVAERHVDGLATDKELGQAVRDVKRNSGRRGNCEWAVYHAVRYKPGSPRAEAAGIARRAAEMVRDAVPIPERSPVQSHVHTDRCFLMIWTEQVDGKTVEYPIESAEELPPSCPPEVVAAVRAHFREAKLAQAREAKADRRAQAAREASFVEELATARTTANAVFVREREAQLQIFRDIFSGKMHP